MKKKLAPLATLLSALLFAAAAFAAGNDDTGSKIDWIGSYSGVVKKAAEDEKPIVFKFYTGWCPHCVRMDRTTWLDDKVTELSDSFIAGKVNADVEKVPVKRYRLTGYPTVIIAEPGGDQVLRLEGYKSGKVVAAYMSAYLKNSDAIAAAHDSLRENRADIDANVVLADFYSRVGLRKEAADHYQKAAKHAEGEQKVLLTAKAAEQLTKGGDPKAALKLLKPYIKGGDVIAPVLLAQANAEQALDNAAKARELYQQVISRFPGTPEAEAAREALAAG